MDTPDGARKKCQRFNIPGDVHELTFSCYKRRPFLSADRSRTYLAQAIAKAWAGSESGPLSIDKESFPAL